MFTHNRRFPFSITILTDDYAVVHCLRALFIWAQKEYMSRTSFFNWDENPWKKDGRLTLHFASAEHRQKWMEKAQELLPGRWSLATSNDDNPLIPDDLQSRRKARQIARKYDIAESVIAELITKKNYPLR